MASLRMHGIPSSIIDAPPSCIPMRMEGVLSAVGYPAVMKVMKAASPRSLADAKASTILSPCPCSIDVETDIFLGAGGRLRLLLLIYPDAGRVRLYDEADFAVNMWLKYKNNDVSLVRWFKRGSDVKYVFTKCIIFP